MKLENHEREIAVAIVEGLVEYGMVNFLTSRDVHNWFRDNGLRELGFCVSGGVTKVCIIHEDLDWVIKVGYVNCSKDYASLEYQNYCLAEEEGLDWYFPTTIYLGEFGGLAFYLQEMADCDEFQVASDWYERLRDSYEEDEEEYNEEELWDEIYDMEDDAKAYLTFRNRTLCDFLYNRRINDLHEGNFGYIGDRMVIIDFSGYAG